jgi:hypothetical protein
VFVLLEMGHLLFALLPILEEDRTTQQLLPMLLM